MREWGEGLDLPGTAEASRTNLALPMSPVLDRAQADQVVAALSAVPVG
jgi:dTDP-4-amino-4,6-dideoxygalactose transaminase